MKTNIVLGILLTSAAQYAAAQPVSLKCIDRHINQGTYANLFMSSYDLEVIPDGSNYVLTGSRQREEGNPTYKYDVHQLSEGTVSTTYIDLKKLPRQPSGYGEEISLRSLKVIPQTFQDGTTQYFGRGSSNFSYVMRCTLDGSAPQHDTVGNECLCPDTQWAVETRDGAQARCYAPPTDDTWCPAGTCSVGGTGRSSNRVLGCDGLSYFSPLDAAEHGVRSWVSQ